MKEELKEFIEELKSVSDKALETKAKKGEEGYFNKLVGAELEYVYTRLELIVKSNV